MSIVLLSATPDASDRDFTAYNAYIDNLGVIYYEGGDAMARDVSLPLRPVRQDTGNNPFEVRPESGDVFAQGDFSLGAGQQFFHRESRDAERYLHGDGYDISVPGKLTHLWRCQEALDSATAGATAQAGDLPFVVDGQVVKRGNGSFPGTWTSETVGSVTIHDLAAQGAELFAGVNDAAAPIYRRTSAGTWAVYQNGAANITLDGGACTKLIAFRGRLIAVGGTDARDIFEVTGAVTAPTTLQTLPEGCAYESIFTNGQYIYASAVNADAGLCEIWHFGLNSGGTAVEVKGSTPVAEGQLLYAGAGYLGQVYLGGGRRNDEGGYDPVLYQGIPSDSGFLNLVKLLQEDGSGTADLSVRAVKPTGESVIFSWCLTSDASTGAAREGLGIYNLARGAFSHHVKKAAPGGTPNRVTSILVYKDRILFTVAGDGLYYEDIGKYEPEATITTSVADWNNAGSKAWDLIEFGHKPLPVGTSIDIEYSLKHPEENIFTAAESSTVAGSEGITKRLSNIESRGFALRWVSNASSDLTLAPTVTNFSVRSNPRPISAEWRLTRFIRVTPKDRLGKMGPQKWQDSRDVKAAIQELLYEWVTLYEPGSSWTVRVESISTINPYSTKNRQTQGDKNKEGSIFEMVFQGTKN